MRPLRDQMAHCRRTLRLPSALTRSPRRSRGLTPCERLVSGSTSNEITSCQATSRSCRALFRLRIRTVVLGDALNECAANVCPTHPPYGGICEGILLADAALLLTFLTCSRFVKEQRRKISLAGVLYPHTPKLPLYSSFMHPFCQGTAPKNFAGNAR